MAYKSAFSLFQPSKEAVLNNFFPFLVIIFLPSFLIVVGEAMNGGRSWLLPTTTVQASEGSQLLQLIGGLLSLIFLPAGFYLELLAAKGKQLTTGEVLSASMHYFWRVIGVVVIMTVVIFLGLLALIVPGVIFIQRFFLAPYFLVNKDLGVREAMSASWDASRGKAGPIWGVIGVMILLSLFSIIPIFGGLICSVLITLYTIAPAYRYFEISSKK